MPLHLIFLPPQTSASFQTTGTFPLPKIRQVYIRPQEHGNHADVRLLEIGKLRFESDAPFSINISDHSAALDRAEHTDELISDGKTHLRVDYKVSGIGSNSCGPELEPQYRLSEKNIQFAYVITPKQKQEERS